MVLKSMKSNKAGIIMKGVLNITLQIQVVKLYTCMHAFVYA